MKKTLLTLLTFITTLLTASAQGSDLSTLTDAIYVQPLSAPAGSQQTLSVCMKNSIEVQTIQFDLYLPDGLTIIANEDGELMTASKERISRFNYFESSKQANGALRLLAQATTTNVPTGDGEIAKVIVGIDNTMSTGNYPIILKDIVLVSKDNVTKKVEEVSTIITIDEPVDSRVVLNEESTTAPVAATNVDVRVIRTINANEWSTIVLPFAMTETQVKEAFGDGVELSDFIGYVYDEENDRMTINFSDVTAIEANHPYIIKVSQNVTEFTADGVDVDPVDEPIVATVKRTRKQWSEFIGTYVAGFSLADLLEDEIYPLFLSGNSFWYASEDTQPMKAFRAYFDFFDYLLEVGSASSRITMSFDNNATGIRTVSSKDKDVYYNLLGQPVSKPSKGAYIHNNKVVILK